MERLPPTDHQFFLAVRRGDLSSVKTFVEKKLVKVNTYDLWGNSPLYLSCLCGHYSVAKYLLESGAHFDKDTNEGYRMMIASLTQRIKDLLKEHHQLQAGTEVDRNERCGFEGFLLKLLNKGIGADLSLAFEGEEFPVHRCLLTARAPKMAKFFAQSWDNTDILDVNNYFSNVSSLKVILCYLYTGSIHSVSYDDVGCVVRDCEELGISSIGPELKKEAEKARKQLFGRLSKFRTVPNENALRTLDVSMERLKQFDKVQKDLAKLALGSIPIKLHSFLDSSMFSDKNNQLQNNDFQTLKRHSDQNMFPDLIILVDNYKFAVHTAFFIGRSEYFHKLFLHDFEDVLDRKFPVGEVLQVIPVGGVRADIFAVILFYIYTDLCCPLSDNICDILYAADMLLFKEIQEKCAAIIANNLDTEIALDTYRMAQQMGLDKLRDKCLKFIGTNMELFIDTDDFATLLKDEASETRCLLLLEDICYYIRSNVSSFESQRHANLMFRKMNSILRKLKLEHLRIHSRIGISDDLSSKSSEQKRSCDLSCNSSEQKCSGDLSSNSSKQKCCIL